MIWPDRKLQKLTNVSVNQTLSVMHAHAAIQKSAFQIDINSVLGEIRESSIPFSHQENNFIPFNAERLIPHMLSTQGPKISSGDIDGDGLMDIFIGGASNQRSALYKQKNGVFKLFATDPFETDAAAEDVDSQFFDADNDGDLDLIVVSGGQQFVGNNPWLKPRLYLNNGKGNFTRSANIPDIYVNASCVRTADIDNDGDLDIFIGGHVIPGKYGFSAPGFILKNNGKGIFTDVSADLFVDQNLGMVTDALWLDVNKDGRIDLVVVGEWMPITFYIQSPEGKFENRTGEYGLTNTNGWWNTIQAGDIDQDGDVDFVVGNLGLNTKLKAAPDLPITLYAGDYDSNGGFDHILLYNRNNTSYPFVSRDQLVKQLPHLKRKFLQYENYKNVKLDDILSAEQIDSGIKKEALVFETVYLESVEGKYILKPLPTEIQMFPVYSLLIEDINGDSFPDILAAGNFHAVQPEIGQHDAGYGVVLINNQQGGFEPLGFEKSGFIVRGEARDIKVVNDPKGNKIILVSRNNSTVLEYRINGKLDRK